MRVGLQNTYSPKFGMSECKKERVKANSTADNNQGLGQNEIKPVVKENNSGKVNTNIFMRFVNKIFGKNEAANSIGGKVETKVNGQKYSTDDVVEIRKEVKTINKNLLKKFQASTNEQNIALAEKLCADKDFPQDYIPRILECTNEQNIALAEKLCADKVLDRITDILRNTNETNIEPKLKIYDSLKNDENILKRTLAEILFRTNEKNIESKLNIYNLLKNDKDFPKCLIACTVRETNEQNITLAEKLRTNEIVARNYIPAILSCTDKQNIALADKLCADVDFPSSYIADILGDCNGERIALAEKLCTDKDFPKDKIGSILIKTDKQDVESKLKLYNLMKNDKKFPTDLIARILKTTGSEQLELCTDLCNTKGFPVETIPDFIWMVNKDTESVIREMCYKKDFPKNMIGCICNNLRSGKKESNVELLQQALITPNLSPSSISKLLKASFNDTGNIGSAIRYVDADKVSKFTRLLQNAKTSPHIVKLLNDGADVDTLVY